MNDLARLVVRLHPAPGEALPLSGLYLAQALPDVAGPFVYTDFVTSLDGRIALANRPGVNPGIPSAITSDRDWRLYLELAARSDVVLVSARYLERRVRQKGIVRILDDPLAEGLVDWRKTQGLAPDPALAVITRDLRLAPEVIRAVHPQPLYVLCGARAPAAQVQAVEASGARVRFAGADHEATGEGIIRALCKDGFKRIYSVMGPRIMHLLLEADVLDRLYLSTTLQVLGGVNYLTLVEGHAFAPPRHFALNALYLDPPQGAYPGQLFAVFDRRRDASSFSLIEAPAF